MGVNARVIVEESPTIDVDGTARDRAIELEDRSRIKRQKGNPPLLSSTTGQHQHQHQQQLQQHQTQQHLDDGSPHRISGVPPSQQQEQQQQQQQRKRGCPCDNTELAYAPKKRRATGKKRP